MRGGQLGLLVGQWHSPVTQRENGHQYRIREIGSFMGMVFSWGSFLWSHHRALVFYVVFEDTQVAQLSSLVSKEAKRLYGQ